MEYYWKKKKMCLLLLMVFLVFEICPRVAIAGSRVKYLPGFEGPLPFELQTGYIGVGEADEVQLYYYFIKSESNPKTDPLILWITGGPGCSALTAILHELGPMMSDRAYNGSLPTMSSNPYAYTKVANILFLDLPVGTGFSYATTQRANHSDNLQAGDQAYQFLRKWLVEHQEYLSHHVYVAGDSYSGIAVPIVIQDISNGNDMGIKPQIDLKGYILGNPVTFLPGEDYYKFTFTHGMGLISDELYKSLVTNCEGLYKDNGQTNPLCSGYMRTFNRLLKGIYKYQILEPTCDSVSYESRRSLAENVQKLNSPATHRAKCRDAWLKLSEIWANDEKVREALHVRKGTTGAWERCRGMKLPFTRTISNTIPYHANLSRKGFRSLVYSGDHDLVVPFMSTEAWIKSLNYSIVDDWRAWIVDGQVAGYTRSYSNQMTFATVKGAGHTAPEYKPIECLAILKRWLSYVPL